MDIKFKLSTYYSDLLNQISILSPETIQEYKNINCKDKNIFEVFEYIKKLTYFNINRIKNLRSCFKN